MTKEITCPSCARGTLIYERWNSKDVVAVCRHVRRCGFRMHIPNGYELNHDERNAFVEKHYDPNA